MILIFLRLSLLNNLESNNMTKKEILQASEENAMNYIVCIAVWQKQLLLRAHCGP